MGPKIRRAPPHQKEFTIASAFKVGIGGILLAFLTSFLTFGYAEPHTINVVTVTEHPQDTRHFYPDVLTEALTRMDTPYRLKFLGNVPQVRAQRMLEDGLIDVFWMVQNPDRDQTYLSTGVGISGGLIGQRVLMIRPENQSLFNDVRTLEDFQALDLTVGFGQGWVDTLVWAANDLKFFEEEGAWSVMFEKLARGRGDFDYLSRSVKEVQDELKEHPSLALEANLLLVYDRDETYYVTPSRPDFRDELAVTLTAMKEDGTLTWYIEQYWGDLIQALALNDRQRISLASPK